MKIKCFACKIEKTYANEDQTLFLQRGKQMAVTIKYSSMEERKIFNENKTYL